MDADETYRIQRINSIIVPTNNDKYGGTICCHDNQLIYNDYDRRTQSFYLTFIPDINVLRTKHNIYRYEPDVTSGPSDDELIQDIAYSNKLSGYLVLNRVRLRLFRPNTNDLIEFQTFGDRTLKRLSCSDTFIYLVVARNTRRYNGDEILLIDYNKEEQACKTFHDVMSHRINRGTGPIVGNISDLAVGSNEQVTIGYCLESRHEVGICLFKVSNYGRAWTLIKHLLLDDCWHNDLSCTPRVEWCEKLNVIIVIEYMTGHLIMLDRNGLVKGECLFMDVENPHEAPINLSISTNAWLCARYESSIVIHKITS
ncbi:unnamed protein product [Rotaria sp. Silwood2]|nr:unnamed protein product [Rotaria sp. Silwood2]CAF4381436.1 unnamed protein product [Rotaria sp. Silwood2]